MTWELLGRLLAQYGAPAVAGFGLAWMIWAGKLRPSREFEKSERDSLAQRADWERRENELRRDFERQLAEKTADITYWRDTAMDLLRRYSREVETSEAAVRTATRVIGRRS